MWYKEIVSNDDKITLSFCGGVLAAGAFALAGCEPPAICLSFLGFFFLCGFICSVFNRRR